MQQRDFSVRVFQEYQDTRRATLFGKLQKHNYRIKEFVATLSDNELNKLIRSLKGLRPQEINFTSVVRLVAAKSKGSACYARPGTFERASRCTNGEKLKP